jgi:hypothetical protein
MAKSALARHSLLERSIDKPDPETDNRKRRNDYQRVDRRPRMLCEVIYGVPQGGIMQRWN